MRGKHVGDAGARSKLDTAYGAIGLPLVFLLAGSAEAVPTSLPPLSDLSFEPGSLRTLGPNLEGGIGTQDPVKPKGRLSIEPGTQTVQWFNWSNWSNCFAGNWHNC